VNILKALSKMSKVLMKLRLQKNINRQIQKENFELRMKLQDLEEEKQRLQDRLLYHEYFHMSIFHESYIKNWPYLPVQRKVTCVRHLQGKMCMLQ
jgi:hypothetical protein